MFILQTCSSFLFFIFWHSVLVALLCLLLIEIWQAISIPSFLEISRLFVSFFLRCSALLCHVAVYQGTCISHPVAPTNTPVTSSWTRVAVQGNSICVRSLSLSTLVLCNTVTIHPVYFFSFFFSYVCLLSSLLLGAGNTADVSCDNTLLTRLTILTGLCQHIQFINMAQTPPSFSIACFRG